MSAMEESSRLHLRGWILHWETSRARHGAGGSAAQCCRWHPSLCDGAEPVPEGRQDLGALCCSPGVKPHGSAGVPALPQLGNASCPLETPAEAGLCLLVISGDFPSALCRMSASLGQPCLCCTSSPAVGQALGLYTNKSRSSTQTSRCYCLCWV